MSDVFPSADQPGDDPLAGLTAEEEARMEAAAEAFAERADEDPRVLVDAEAAAVEADIDLASLAKQRDDYLDALRRLQADFENYKKRMVRQQTEHLERAAEQLVTKLLPVFDTADLAIAHGAGEGGGFDAVQQIWSALFDALEKEGLERIDPMGLPFDPNEHDAVMHEPGDGEPEVIDVMRAGYRWKGRVLRPAMVKVRG
ncbi:MAG: molecular chaperone GrpE [Acidimicrobiaceae bacterium]|nr:molecular chaperone GrpE [Acidimicrobiaceae bacterium]